MNRQAAALLVGASLAWPCGDAFAASQLFKCVDAGRTVYQQQACSPSAQPEVAASAPHIAAKANAPGAMAKTVTPAGEAAPVAPGKLKTPSLPASGAPATSR